MRRVSIAFLLLTLAISTFFIHVPHRGKIGFVFHPTTINPCTGEVVELTLSYNQYIWMVGEMLVPLMLAWMIWDIAQRYGDKYQELAKWYLLIVIADSILWFFAYYDPLKDYKITWNIIKTALFILAICYELWKTRRTLKEG